MLLYKIKTYELFTVRKLYSNGGSLVDRSWNETITDSVRTETIGILHGVATRSGDVGRSDAVDGVVFGGSDEILESK